MSHKLLPQVMLGGFMSNEEKTTDNKRKPHTDYWFVEEFENVQTLAELCRIGKADKDDIDRIFWMGRRLKGMIHENIYLKNILDEERAFNIKISEIASKFEVQFKSQNSYNVNGVESDCDNLYDNLRKVVDELEFVVKTHKKLPPRSKLYSKTTKIVLFFVNVIHNVEFKILNLLKKDSRK